MMFMGCLVNIRQLNPRPGRLKDLEAGIRLRDGEGQRVFIQAPLPQLNSWQMNRLATDIPRQRRGLIELLWVDRFDAAFNHPAAVIVQSPAFAPS